MNTDKAQIVTRLEEFIKSSVFEDLPEESLSEYWAYFQDTITFNFGESEVDVKGESGIYTPRTSRSFFQKIGSLLSSPRAYGRIVVEQLLRKAIRKSGMTFDMVSVPPETAFDAVMTCHPATGFTRSPYRLDFKEVAATPGAFTNSGDVISDYLKIDQGVYPNGQVFLSYYYCNVLKHLGGIGDDFSFMEIGAGNGNLVLQLLRHRKRVSYVVDLPRTLVGSISFLTKHRPDLNVLLPHEVTPDNIAGADLVFLTPSQIDLIPGKSLSLVANTHSFQEMTVAQVKTYFDLAERTLEPGGHLFTVNRVEKIPGNPDTFVKGSQAEVLRFSEYPWRPEWETCAYEICSMNRLLNRDNSFIRICRV